MANCILVDLFVLKLASNTYEIKSLKIYSLKMIKDDVILI